MLVQWEDRVGVKRRLMLKVNGSGSKSKLDVLLRFDLSRI